MEKRMKSRYAELPEGHRLLRDRILNHRIYASLKTLAHVRVFMENHVFAVWDFMCLLKALQRELTSVTLPWLPGGNRLSRRLINEIVLEEESDEALDGGYSSHFELYHAAMESCGASTSKIEKFLAGLRSGQSVSHSLRAAHAPAAAIAFVETTWEIVESGDVHRIAAAFALGREELIPDMFRAVLCDMQKAFPDELRPFCYYLERHVQLDEERHAPMALRMLDDICKDDETKWREVEETVGVTLQARIDLWDDVLRQMFPSNPSDLIVSP